MESSDVYSLLKKACSAQTKFKTFSDIQPGVYDIDRFEFCNTVYGNRVAIWITGFRMFLPTRFNASISSAEQVNTLNLRKYVLIYNGRDDHRGNRIMLDFKPLDEYMNGMRERPNHEIAMGYDCVG